MSAQARLDLLAAARTFLFVPAHEPGKVEKALGARADAVILDLEDTVPAAVKERARADAAELLRRSGGERLLLVRVNDPRGAVGAADLAALAGLPALALVPKADRESLAALPEGLPVAALVETAAGMADVREVAADPRVHRLMLGSLDLAADVGLVLTADGLELAAARWSLVLASRLAGIAAPIDGVYPHHRDGEGLRRDATAARNAGMGAKASIHPGQLDVLTELFEPSPSELEWAERILGAWEAAGPESGVIDVDGEMVDAPVLVRARAIRAAAGAAHGSGR